jgi:hypothetical protein
MPANGEKGDMLQKLCRRLTLLHLLAAMLLWPLMAQAGVKSTSYYNLDYGRWSGVAEALAPYLDAAFTTPSNLLSYNNQGHGKIDIHCYSDPRDDTLGYMNPGENSLYLNFYGGNSTSASYLSDYGDTVAHETAHVLYYNKTGLADRYDLYSQAMLSDIWVAETMAFYVGSVAYPQGPRESKSSLGAQLYRYSKGGSQRSSWYDSGLRYDGGSASSLDYVQLQAAGLFLATYGDGKGYARLSDYLARYANYEAALQYAFGKPSGQYGTASGASVNTLYSEYIKYYFGSY